jgi:hypothetical protein
METNQQLTPEGALALNCLLIRMKLEGALLVIMQDGTPTPHKASQAAICEQISKPRRE